MSKWSEIRNDFYDDDEEAIYIDAWITDDDDEEGKVIAKVRADGSVEYLDDEARTDKYAQEMIKEAIKDMKNE